MGLPSYEHGLEHWTVEVIEFLPHWLQLRLRLHSRLDMMIPKFENADHQAAMNGSAEPSSIVLRIVHITALIASTTLGLDIF